MYNAWIAWIFVLTAAPLKPIPKPFISLESSIMQKYANRLRCAAVQCIPILRPITATFSLKDSFFKLSSTNFKIGSAKSSGLLAEKISAFSRRTYSENLESSWWLWFCFALSIFLQKSNIRCKVCTGSTNFSTLGTGIFCVVPCVLATFDSGISAWVATKISAVPSSIFCVQASSL